MQEQGRTCKKRVMAIYHLIILYQKSTNSWNIWGQMIPRIPPTKKTSIPKPRCKVPESMTKASPADQTSRPVIPTVTPPWLAQRLRRHLRHLSRKLCRGSLDQVSCSSTKLSRKQLKFVSFKVLRNLIANSQASWRLCVPGSTSCGPRSRAISWSGMKIESPPLFLEQLW